MYHEKYCYVYMLIITGELPNIRWLRMASPVEWECGIRSELKGPNAKSWYSGMHHNYICFKILLWLLYKEYTVENIKGHFKYEAKDDGGMTEVEVRGIRRKY